MNELRVADATLLVLYGIVIATMLVFCLAIGGCAGVPKVPAVPHTFYSVPSTFNNFSSGLDVIAILSVVVLGGALALFLLVPTQHRISIALAGGAGGVLLITLALKLTLWLIPWIVLGLVALSATALVYEIIYKRKHGVYDKPGDGLGNI